MAGRRKSVLDVREMLRRLRAGGALGFGSTHSEGARGKPANGEEVPKAG